MYLEFRLSLKFLTTSPLRSNEEDTRAYKRSSSRLLDAGREHLMDQKSKSEEFCKLEEFRIQFEVIVEWKFEFYEYLCEMIARPLLSLKS